MWPTSQEGNCKERQYKHFERNPQELAARDEDCWKDADSNESPPIDAKSVAERFVRWFRHWLRDGPSREYRNRPAKIQDHVSYGEAHACREQESTRDIVCRLNVSAVPKTNDSLEGTG